MHWIIQNNIYNEEGFKYLIDTLETLRLPYSIHKCIPFLGTLDPEPEPIEDRVIVMGSYTLAREAIKRGWNPGVFLNDNFNTEIQSSHWGKLMMNADHQIHAFAQVPEQREPFFIRPVHDSKAFTGEVTDWPTFIEWRDKVLNLTPDDNPTVTYDTEVLISSVKEIYGEYRIWIVDGKAVAWSQYKVGRRKLKNYIPDVDQRIRDFAEKCAAIWSPHRAYVLDVFETENGLFIGEVNNLNSAGFYAANMGKLIMSLEEAFG